MRFKLLLLSVCSLALLSACSTVVKMDQTCVTCVQSQRLACTGSECPVSFMVGSECLVTMVETGEHIHLNEILKQEAITPAKDIPFTLAKVNGNYYVIGGGFKNMWILSPSDRNEAKLCKIELPVQALNNQPVFELFNTQLKMRGQNNEYAYIYDDDHNKWINLNLPKAGD